MAGMLNMDRAHALLAIAIGLAALVGMWLLGTVASGFVRPVTLTVVITMLVAALVAAIVV
jgi:hypothetical protein